MEAIYFDEGVRASKRQQLESKLLQVAPLSFIFDILHPLYQTSLCLPLVS
jgi:hypothetical protein